MLLLIGGIYLPIPSAAVGLGIMIARIINAIGYANGEPKSKGVGAIANDLLTLTLFVFAMFSSIKFIIGDPFAWLLNPF